MRNETVIENRQITKDLLHQISISENQEKIFLTVKFLSDRFVIEKSFGNNFIGLNEMSEVCEKLDSEAKVFRYLRIGEEENDK